MKKLIVELPDYPSGSFLVLNSIKDIKPQFVFRTLDECRDYLDENGFDYDIVRYGSLVPSNFLDDLEKKCDVILAKALNIAKRWGCTFHHDIIYKANAAWKDEKIHYCYQGDFGGCAWISEEPIRGVSDVLIVRECMLKLYGVSMCLWELGFQLTFDSDYNHSIMHRRSDYYLSVELSDIEGV